MKTITLIGGALHGKQMDIAGGNILNVPIMPNSRTPKQQARRIGTLVYKKITEKYYRIISGYYSQPCNK